MQTYKVQNSIAAMLDSEDYVACKQLTVVTLTYNNFEQLEETLESIKSIRPKEALVINGGQCTKTLDYLNSKANCFRDYFQLKHISEPDQGISNAMNKGVKNATSEYINFIHSGDCVCDPKYFQTSIGVLESNYKISYTYSDIVMGNRKQGYSFLERGSHTMLYTSKTREVLMPNHQTIVYRKSVFNKIGLFSTKYRVAGDFDYCVRMSKENLLGSYIKMIAIAYNDQGRTSTQRIRTWLDFINMIIGNKILIINLKHVWGSFLFIITPILLLIERCINFLKTCLKIILLLGAKNIKYNLEQNKKRSERNIDINTLLEKLKNSDKTKQF